MTTKYLKKKLYGVCGIVLLKICLELAYIYSIMPIWKNLKFGFSPNWTSCILSYIYCIVLVLLSPETKGRLSSLIYHFFVITSVVPLMIYYWTNNKSATFVFGVFCMMLIIVLLIRIKGRGLVFYEKYGGTWKLILSIFFLFYIVGGVWLCVRGGGLDSRALSLVDVYEIRKGATTLNTLESYWLQWTVKAFTPFFMGYFLYYKKYIRCGCCMLIQIGLYFTFGHKAYLLSIILFWMIYAVSKLFVNAEIIYSGLFAVMGIIAFLYGVWNKNKIFWLVAWQGVMRMLFEPAKIKFQYFEFFLEHAKLFFSEGIIGKVFDLTYPYDTAIGFVITEYFMGEGAVSNNNTGVIADMYAQMGYTGMVVGGIIIGILFGLMDQVSTNVPIPYKIAIVSFICITLNDNPLQTTLLSGGWIILILLLLMFNSQLYSEKNIKDIMTYETE